MGWKYEVEAYKSVLGEFKYVEVYTGNSFFGALRAMRKAKRTSGCVRLSWR